MMCGTLSSCLHRSMSTGLQFLDGVEGPVCDGFSDHRPESFGRLKLRGVRRLEQKVDVVGNDEFWGSVTGSAVKEEDELLV